MRGPHLLHLHSNHYSILLRITFTFYIHCFKNHFGKQFYQCETCRHAVHNIPHQARQGLYSFILLFLEGYSILVHSCSFVLSDINECFDASKKPVCQNNAECLDGVNKFTCQCLKGFEGNTCESGKYLEYKSTVHDYPKFNIDLCKYIVQNGTKDFRTKEKLHFLILKV